MPIYHPPLEDMQFVLFDVFNADAEWQTCPSIANQVDRDVAQAMLTEAGKIAEECIAPLNRESDEQGAVWQQGKVTTPPGFKQAYQTFCEGGWMGLTGNPEYGGLGMPKSLSMLVDEIMYSASCSFNLYPALSMGACLAIDAHASETLKQRFLPKLYEGIWSGTMCLTESHAGSDLGLIRTKAADQQDGTYRITGTKIFITGGDHDLTDNIVHLVLARLPDAPAGYKGISLFLVPKYWVNEDDSLTAENGVTCGSIEHKMGIKGSATCVMNFDDARGYLVGGLNRGLQCMFTMMNIERLSIGIQGTGCAETSYQNAVAYSKDRLQGKDVTGVGSGSVADPIIVHPDVRRMLMVMKSSTEAGRALAVYMGMQLDRAKHSEDAAVRQSANDRVALLTPVAKSMFTDMGLESTILGQQVFGGHGYIREWGQEQLVRDARIAQIYEGTNGIQAMDLLQRKVAANKGESLALYLGEIKAFSASLKAEQLRLHAEDLTGRCQVLSELTERLLSQAKSSPATLGAAACEYQFILGYITYGYLWLKMMLVAVEKNTTDSSLNTGMNTKLKTGQFYFQRLLPRIDSLVAQIDSGADAIMGLSEDEF